MRQTKIYWTVFIFAISSSSLAASFDCNKSRSRTEKLICSNAQLSSLDESLNSAYKDAGDRMKDKPALLRVQRRWLSYTLAQCSDAMCLEKAISERIALLNDVAPSGDPLSTWTGHFVRYWKGHEDKDRATISVLGLKNGRLFLSGTAIWAGPKANTGQVNTGEMEAYVKQQVQDGMALFDSDGCTAQLRLTGNTLEVKDESGCGGLNVTFDGQYKRK
jgi:uncharacterized protein